MREQLLAARAGGRPRQRSAAPNPRRSLRCAFRARAPVIIHHFSETPLRQKPGLAGGQLKDVAKGQVLRDFMRCQMLSPAGITNSAVSRHESSPKTAYFPKERSAKLSPMSKVP